MTSAENKEFWKLRSTENVEYGKCECRNIESFPFEEKFRKFRFGVKRKTFFGLPDWKMWSCSKVSSVFSGWNVPIGLSCSTLVLLTCHLSYNMPFGDASSKYKRSQKTIHDQFPYNKDVSVDNRSLSIIDGSHKPLYAWRKSEESVGSLATSPSTLSRDTGLTNPILPFSVRWFQGWGSWSSTWNMPFWHSYHNPDFHQNSWTRHIFITKKLIACNLEKK